MDNLLATQSRKPCFHLLKKVNYTRDNYRIIPELYNKKPLQGFINLFYLIDCEKDAI